MTEKHLLRLAVVSLALVAVFDIFAAIFYLYWYYWWFDMPVHLLAGFFTGVFCLWLYFFSRVAVSPVRSSAAVMMVATIGALSVGLVWELFEYFAGITFNAVGSYALDTVKDLTMDVAGGLIAYFYFIIKDFHYPEQHE